MIELHPNIIEKEGKKEFVVLPFDEFLQMKDIIQEFEDLKDLREAISKEKNISGYSLASAKDKLNI